MYRGRLERDLKHWTAQGLLDAPTAGRLLQEYDSRPSSFSLGRVLMIIAALLVAANWEAAWRMHCGARSPQAICAQRPFPSQPTPF